MIEEICLRLRALYEIEPLLVLTSFFNINCE